MSERIFITKLELDTINKIIQENNIQNSIELIYNNESGIGSTLEMEFDHELHGRYVTVRVNITDSNSW